MRLSVTCNKCGYSWTPHKGITPKECPKCKSYEWARETVEIAVKNLWCAYCGYRWVSRISSEPRTCPECKSHNWNKIICRDCSCFIDNKCSRGKLKPSSLRECDGFMLRYDLLVRSGSEAEVLPDI